MSKNKNKEKDDIIYHGGLLPEMVIRADRKTGQIYKSNVPYITVNKEDFTKRNKGEKYFHQGMNRFWEASPIKPADIGLAMATPAFSVVGDLIGTGLNYVGGKALNKLIPYVKKLDNKYSKPYVQEILENGKKGKKYYNDINIADDANHIVKDTKTRDIVKDTKTRDIVKDTKTRDIVKISNNTANSTNLTYNYKNNIRPITNTILTLPTEQQVTREQLKAVNRWAKYFGIAPIPLSKARYKPSADRAVQEMIKEQNRFLRGVRKPTYEQRIALRAALAKEGNMNPSLYDMMEYAATHSAGYSSAGRANIRRLGNTDVSLKPRTGQVSLLRKDIDPYGTIYTSNSGELAAGYSDLGGISFNNKHTGLPFIVSRPTYFRPGGSYMDWIQENDYTLAGSDGEGIFDSKLNHARAIDLMRNTKLPEGAKLSTEEKNKLIKEIWNNEYINKDIDRIFTNYDRILHELGNKIPKTKFSIDYMNSLSDKQKINYLKYLDNPKYAHTPFNKNKIYYSDDDLKQIKLELKKEQYNKALDYYNRIYPTDFDYKLQMNNPNIIDSERLRNVTRNKGNAIQHFIFRAPVGQKVLNSEGVYIPTNEEFIKATRDHYGKYTPGFSRITKKMGGKTKHKIEAEGGEIIQSNKPIKVKNGGIAIPLGNGFSLLQGKKHSQGGIDVDFKGDGRIFSDVPFLNGISPAKRLLNGENPNLVFNKQELYKNINGITDSGNKKKYGYNGDDENILMLDNTKPYEAPYKNIVSDIINEHVQPILNNSRIIPENLSRSDINALYKNNIKIHTDSNGDLYENVNDRLTPYTDLLKLDTINKNNVLPSIRKKLDYIGGDTEETRHKFISKIPNTVEHVKKIAKQYGVSPNVMLERMAHEGAFDTYITDYNNYSNSAQQKLIDSKFSLGEYNHGFKHFGLDDTATFLKEGKVKLLNPINWWDGDAKNEKGRIVNFADGETNSDRIELMAATLKYIQDEMKKRNYVNKDNLDIYTSAAFNRGLYNNELNDSAFIHKNYQVPKYVDDKKRMGGNINKNGLIYNLNGNVVQGLGYVPSTGERSRGATTRNKALFGLKLKNDDGTLTKLGKANEWMKSNPEIISGVTNAIGSIASNIINRNMLSSLETPMEPIPLQSAKLKTNVNINPQLDAAREQQALTFRDIQNNTNSSNVALSRLNQARFANKLNTDSLYSTKENTETELINKDRLNQQEVFNQNIANRIAYNDKLVNFRNDIRDKRAENNVSLITGLAQSVIGNIAANQQRKQDENSMILTAFASPNAPLDLMKYVAKLYPNNKLIQEIIDKRIKQPKIGG